MIIGIMFLFIIGLLFLILAAVISRTYREEKAAPQRAARSYHPPQAGEQWQPPVIVVSAPPAPPAPAPTPTMGDALPEGYEAITIQQGPARQTQRHVTPGGAAVEIEIETSAGATVTTRVTDATPGQRQTPPNWRPKIAPKDRRREWTASPRISG